jgi:hypothetical protein
MPLARELYCFPSECLWHPGALLAVFWGLRLFWWWHELSKRRGVCFRCGCAKNCRLAMMFAYAKLPPRYCFSQGQGSSRSRFLSQGRKFSSLRPQRFLVTFAAWLRAFCTVGIPGAVLVPCLSKTSWLVHPIRLPPHTGVSEVNLVSCLCEVFVRKE